MQSSSQPIVDLKSDNNSDNGSYSGATHASESYTLPAHVAIIMDGNGRWAQAQGKKRVAGHRAGVETVRRIVSRASEMELTALTLYAFSSENWRRPQEEVSLLMELFMTVLGREVKKLHRNNVRLRIIGDVSAFSSRLQKSIRESEQLTAANTGLTLNIAANYGGRWDIVNATRRLATHVANGELQPEQIDEQVMSDFICMSDLPEVDLMIRTGGDHRISNYLLWQAAYAELCFVPQFWPDFTADEFSAILRDFGQRERRFGCTGEQVRQSTELPQSMPPAALAPSQSTTVISDEV